MEDSHSNGVLPSRHSEIKGAIEKTNVISKCPVNKLFAVKNTYHDTSQTDIRGVATGGARGLWDPNFNFQTKQDPTVSDSNIRDIAF